MNEINFNATNRSQNVDKALSSAGNQKNVDASQNPPTSDSIQISKVPDLSSAEAAIEEDFARLRSKLQEKAESAAYPPLETINRLAQILAVEGSQD